MFEATFLGHQSWLFASEGARVLVDPVLVDDFGHRGHIGHMYPPRDLALDRFPRIDAVLLTHEHDDHFSIPSLNRLSRSIPILLSSRSSVPARVILEEMGFQVALVYPNSSVRFAELSFHFFSPNHVADDNGDEWDVLPFFVHHSLGDGSFFSAVDVRASVEMVELIKRISPRPGIWCFTNNTSDWSFLDAQRAGTGMQDVSDTRAMTARVVDEFWRVCVSWGTPAAVVCCGGGYSFAGARTWLNAHVFPANSASAMRALSALEGDGFFVAPSPGQTVSMKDGVCTGVGSVAYVKGLEGPDRTYNRRNQIIETYEPASNRYQLSEEELEELQSGLCDFAAAVYWSPIFKGLYSVPGTISARSTAALVLLTGTERNAYVLEYQPQGCTFVFAHSTNPRSEYLVGLECWATDLHALFRGEFPPMALFFGRMRTWNNIPQVVSRGFASLLIKFFHPLHRPDAYMNLYRGLYALESRGGPQVPGPPG